MPKGKPNSKKPVVKEEPVVTSVEPTDEFVPIAKTIKATVTGTFTPAPLTREDYFAISNATDGYLSEAEVNLLWNAAGRAVVGAWVEVGSYYGRSTVLIAGQLALAGMGALFAVDPHSGDLSYPSHFEGKLLVSDHLSNVGSTLEKFRETINKSNLNDFVMVVTQKFTDVTEIPTPVEFAFVDGLHNIEDVKADWEHLKPLLAPNAIVVFHDYQEWFGPTLVVDTAIAYNELQFIEQAESLIVCRYIGAK